MVREEGEEKILLKQEESPHPI